MKITPYNHHREGSFLPSFLILKPRIPGRIESSLLSNQFKLRLSGAFLLLQRCSANPTRI
jgi:hypothetical protein